MIVAFWVDGLVFVTVNEGILPLPLAANPMFVLLFVQLNTVFVTELVKFIAVVWVLWHKVWSAVIEISGIGFTVIKKVSELPVQGNPLLVKEGVAMIVAIWGDGPVLVTVYEGILQIPLAANPMDV